MMKICMSVYNNLLLKKIMLFKIQSVQYAYFYYITRRCNFIQVSVEFAFKNVYNGESDIISFKFDSGYHGGNDLR